MNDEEAMTRIRERYKTSFTSEKNIGKKCHFSCEQVAILSEYYEQSPDWDFVKKLDIARKVGLNPQQVKKWNFDE